MSDTKTVTLTEFLTARLDEDEAVARAAFSDLDEPGEAWRPSGLEDPWPTQERHVLRHDPARVLAEVKAKRRILELDDEVLRREVRNGDASGAGASLMLSIVLRLLALPYADHPDYDEAWRP